MAATPKAQKTTEIKPLEMEEGVFDVHVLGRTPLIYNSVSFKAQTELLLPRGRKTSAEKATSLKHDPLTEYRDSVYRLRENEEGPTRLVTPAAWFKKAIAEAAKRVPGATKAEIQQLLWVDGEMTPCFGVPYIFMSLVRSADMSRTPDIRTRALLPQWATKLTIKYIKPQLSTESIATLLQWAGKICGVGDWRQEKGSGSFGQFDIVNPEDPRYQAVMKQTMTAQDAALLHPTSYDETTEKLIAHFDTTIRSKEFKRKSAPPLQEEMMEALDVDLSDALPPAPVAAKALEKVKNGKSAKKGNGTRAK